MQMKTTKSHLSEWPSSINQQETSASEDVEKGEPFGIGGGNADYCSQQCGFAQKIKNGTALWPSGFTSGNLSKETQHTNLKEYMFIAALFAMAKIWSIYTMNTTRP